MENKDTVIGNNFDIIDVAKSIAKEKGITSEEVLEAMETAIAKAGRTKYGHELDIRAHVNRDNGYIGLFRYQEVVKDLEELPSDERINKINLKDLPKDNQSLKEGEFLIDELPPLDFGRIAVQTAKQVIYQKVKEVKKSFNLMNLKTKLVKL